MSTRRGNITKLSSGFTLIELLVVIAIIAILAAILFPVFAAARERAKQSACTSNLNQIAKSILMYSDDNKGYYPANSDFEDKNDYSGYPAIQAAPYPWVILLPYTKGREVWRCPGDKGTYFSNAGGPIASKLPGAYTKKAYDMWKAAPTDPLLKDCWSSYVTNKNACWNQKNNYAKADPIKIDQVRNPVWAPAAFDVFQGGTVAKAKSGFWHISVGNKPTWNFAFLDGHVKPLNADQIANPDNTIDPSNTSSYMNLWDYRRYRE